MDSECGYEIVTKEKNYLSDSQDCHNSNHYLMGLTKRILKVFPDHHSEVQVSGFLVLIMVNVIEIFFTFNQVMLVDFGVDPKLMKNEEVTFVHL